MHMNTDSTAVVNKTLNFFMLFSLFFILWAGRSDAASRFFNSLEVYAKKKRHATKKR